LVKPLCPPPPRPFDGPPHMYINKEMNEELNCFNICLSNSHLNTLSALLYESTKRANQEKIKNSSKMPSSDLTDLILALLHRVAGPRHRRAAATPAPPLPSPSASPRSRVLEWPRPLPLTGRLTDRRNHRTPMPLRGVIGVGRVPSTVGGCAPTRLHLRTSPRHRVNKGRWRE
jgi:hypothetical protein